MALTLKNVTTAAAKDVTGTELRRRIREEDGERHAEAMAEFERRRANLRGAVIAPWELAARGPDPEKWAPE